ncbi:hypothetical protein L1987_49298 [Smallanthus sonchifolius]|uniref:Uncharacterized protein n=1 Tax=Smallanthus sonchifolius TaxID=185202 RepID=A0ACB9FU40_9ASTR|nr:hypothetical protein L1987_49298 [Smallanthus sonchifolius]
MHKTMDQIITQPEEQHTKRKDQTVTHLEEQPPHIFACFGVIIFFQSSSDQVVKGANVGEHPESSNTKGKAPQKLLCTKDDTKQSMQHAKH